MKSFVEIGNVTNSWKMNRKLSCVEGMYAELSDTLQCGMDTINLKLFICAQKNFVLPFINRVLLIVIFLISPYTFVSLADPMILKMVTSLYFNNCV